jgi:hypothetical protein
MPHFHPQTLVYAASAAVLEVAVSSCGISSVYPLAKSEAADALTCPADSVEQVSSTRRSAYDYWFEGCGRRVAVHWTWSSASLMCSPEGPTAIPAR